MDPFVAMQVIINDHREAQLYWYVSGAVWPQVIINRHMSTDPGSVYNRLLFCAHKFIIVYVDISSSITTIYVKKRKLLHRYMFVCISVFVFYRSYISYILCSFVHYNVHPIATKHLPNTSSHTLS